MTFRPSVLPDRDNDILSTFTRSFERARQLVRQDQADRRAQQAFDLQQQAAQTDLDLKALEFALTTGGTMGIEEISPDAQDDTIADALAGDRAPSPAPRAGAGAAAAAAGAAAAPARTTQAAGTGALDRPDFEVTLPGGRRFRISPAAQRRAAEAATRRAATVEDIADRETPTSVQERDQATNAALNFIDQGLPSRNDQPIFTREQIESGQVDPQLVIDAAEQQIQSEQILGRQLTGIEARADVEEEREIREQLQGLPSATGARVESILRGIEDEARERLVAEAGIDAQMPGFSPREFSESERAEHMDQAVRRAFTAGVINEQQRDMLLGRTAGTRPPLNDTQLGQLNQRFRGMSDQDVRSVMEGAGFSSAAISQYLRSRGG